MNVPADLSAERLIREYLARVAEAGTRYLPMGRRGAFVQRTRRRIEREIGPGGARDAEHVRGALARLGEPEDLVRAERARMDAERIKRQPGNLGLGGADEAEVAAPFEVRSIRSRWKPGKERPPRRPPSADEADPGQQDRPAGRRGTPGQGKRKGLLGGLLLDRPGRHEAQPGEHEPQHGPRPPEATAGQAPGNGAGQAPDDTAGHAVDGTVGQTPGNAAGQTPGNAAGQAPGAAAGRPQGGQSGQDPGWVPWAWRSAGAPASDHTVPLTPGHARTPAPGGPGTQAPGEIGARPLGGAAGAPTPQQPANWVRPAAAGAGQAGNAARSGGDTPPGGTPIPPREAYTVRAAAAALGRGAARLTVEAAGLAREYPLESVSVTLLAIGGLVLPFPYWLFGGLLGGILAIWSRIWNARDKWTAVAGPPVFVLVGTLVAALIIGGRGHAVSMYLHTFRLYGGSLLRVGNALCAVYLALQARRGPQRRLPPWRR